MQVVLALCVVAVSAVLVTTLLAARKLALRADTVLAVVEREIRPMLDQMEGLTAELRELSQGAGEDLKRIRVRGGTGGGGVAPGVATGRDASARSRGSASTRAWPWA